MNNEIEVFVNQVGYLPSQIKFAYVTGCKPGDFFSVCSKNGTDLFVGTLSLGTQDRLVDTPVFSADFSSFTQEGEFFIKVENSISYTFKISKNVYKPLLFSTLNYFYLSRCGQEIDVSKKNHTAESIWNRPGCHTTPALIYGTKKTKTVLGGWHDAGDYGRYIVAGAKTVMDLLIAYENTDRKYSDFDILNEVKFELKWMLEMQREDGAVYHKISCYHFCAFINPQDEKDQLVIAPVSTAATADFAGCTAYASKFYSEIDPNFSESLIIAAEKAQQYLNSHEDELYKNPEEITTGGYGDFNVKDERYFALCSLYDATEKIEYLNGAKKIRAEAKAQPDNPNEPWKKHWFQGFGWGSVAGYGTEILLNREKCPDKDFIEDLKEEILGRAEKILKVVENSSFGTALERIFWGSNGHACDEAHMLLLAYKLTQNQNYKNAALKQLHYVLGCNPMNLCYVTGNGTASTLHPHHRPSGALKSCMPGMLAGGPCEGLADAEAKRLLQGQPPLKCYADVTGSYSTNEIAIYWNSPLALLITAF